MINIIYYIVLTFLINWYNGFTYTSYQTKIECYSKYPIQYPKNLNELQSIVNNAINSGTKVRVIGTRHSVTDAICTDGIPIHLEYFNDVSMNERDRTATLGAGLQLIDAMDMLSDLGYTVNHLPSFGGITVGGAIAVGAHGSSLIHLNKPSDYLVGVTIIDGNGRLRRIHEDDQDFDSFRVNFGLLGIIINATFKVVPQHKMEMYNYHVNDDILIDNPNSLVNMARKNDWFQFWWFPTSKGLVISKGNFVSVKNPGNAQTNLVSNASPAVASITSTAIEAMQAINNTFALNALQALTEKSFYQKGLTRDQVFTDGNQFVNPATGYAYRMMTSRCTKCGWHTLVNDVLGILAEEFAVAIELSKLPQVISDMNKLFIMYPTSFPLFGIFFRFSLPSDGLLALSHGHETVHIDWTFPMRLNQFEEAPYHLSVMQTLMQLLVFKYRGRPHWGKNGLAYFSHNILSERYDLKRFQSAAEKYDPNGLFSNKFGNRILGIGRDQYDVPDRMTHCAIQDYCICQKDDDCGIGQRCGTLIGYPVCVEGDLVGRVGAIIDNLL